MSGFKELKDSKKDPEDLKILRESESSTESDLKFSKAKVSRKTVQPSVKISKKLSDDSKDFDEDNEEENEELNPNDPNKTLDFIFTVQMFGHKDPNEVPINFESKTAKLWERMLHPLQYGSLRGSIFALSSMCLEAGTLVLAIRCEQFGMVNFLIALILGGLVAYLSLVLMIEAGKNVEMKEYSRVVRKILGPKMGVFVDCNITLYLFGALISFQVIIFQILGSVTYDIMKIMDKLDKEKYPTFERFKDDYWRESLYIKIPIMFGVAALSFPLCLLKDVSKMRWASLFGVLALIYSIVVIVIESFFFLFKKNWDLIDEMNWFDISGVFSLDNGLPFFSGFATVFYIYSCHAGAFPVYKTLKNPTTKRIRKVFRRSILLDICIYVSVAAASFITCPKNPPELILYRENLEGFDPDYFVIIAKVGIIFNLFFSTPPNYAGLRLSLFELIWGNTNITNVKNFVVTLIMFIIIVLIGALYDKILDYIALLGGFCSVVYCILIPGLIYVNSGDIPKCSLQKLAIIFLIVTLTIIGYTSGICTILFNMVKIGE